MKKHFNTAGFCRPDWHYMVNPLRNLKEKLYELIKKNQYFIIHAPRQTGKTTLLHSLAHDLNREGEYISLVFSAETAGWQSITENVANSRILESLYNKVHLFLKQPYIPPDPASLGDISIGRYLTQWSRSIDKPIVLFIDEIDALYDDVFISVLRQLRDGFQSRPKNFPASIALVGLRDIRDYRIQAREGNPTLGTASPFNVKSDSLTLGNFSKEDVQNLYLQHTQETGQVFTQAAINKLYEYTNGQPWLTNAFANQIVYHILKDDYTITIDVPLVEQAKQMLIKRRDTHLDSLADKLREKRVRKVVTSIINGEYLLYDDLDDDLRYCRDLGLIKESSPVQFANDLYQEIITRVMGTSFEVSFGEDDAGTHWYVKEDGGLDMDKLLKAFQKFYRRHSEHWLDRFEFKEAAHQLLLMAFLQRVVNGGGRIEREMAVGSGRVDLVVIWKEERFVLELKLKYGSWTKEDGLEQINRYLDKLGLKKGYLVLFERKPSSEISWEERMNWEDVTFKDKQITLVEL